MMRIPVELRRRLSPEELERLRNTKGRAGRPVGTQKFEAIDHLLIGMADLYLRGHPGVSVKAAIRAVVEGCWNRRPGESEHDFYEREQIGASIPAATARIFARLRADSSWYAEVYPIAKHVETRVRKIDQLK
jgi:hypothetical protein